jgi:hypothetical protein
VTLPAEHDFEGMLTAWHQARRRRALLALVAGYVIFSFGLFGLRTHILASAHRAHSSIELAILSGFLVLVGTGVCVLAAVAIARARPPTQP